jgi:hypothetical protein
MKKLIAATLAAVALVALTAGTASADTQWGRVAAHHHVR